MLGKPLKEAVARNKPVREGALFGMHGGHVNCTDGRYVYMRAPADAENRPLYDYTLMPTHMRSRFSADELQNIELAPPFEFTKGCKVLKIEVGHGRRAHPFKTLLFDLESDPGQLCPIKDKETEERMKGLIVKLMRENDAPEEQYVRLGLI
jgi:hypothetical protein